MDARIHLTLKLISDRDMSVPFPLTDLCRWLGLSEAYLLRLFHREVGKTLRQHLLEARMSRAVQLLKDTARPIKQLALECGYSDISNFYRDFKRVHGATPRELRLTALVELQASTFTSAFPQQSC